MSQSLIQADVVVLGAGTAGLAAYRAASAAGARTVLVERGPYGTTCARVGCMPSKLLIAAAHAAHRARHSAPFGVQVAEVTIDGRRVMERVRAERDRFVGLVVDGIEQLPPADRLDGEARFLDAHTLAVGERRISAKTVVIATGSRPQVLPMFEGLGDRLVTNEEVFEWRELPRRVALFGPGVIGLELGQALARLGVSVRAFGVDCLVGPLTDDAVRSYAFRTFHEELQLDANAKVHRVWREDDKVWVELERGGERVRESFDFVLAATGRRPNVDRLGLENTSLELDRRGVPLFDKYSLQAGESHIFIAGDAANHRPILHEASDEGRIAGENAARYPAVRPGKRRTPLSIVFSDPQIAVVGSTRRDLEAQDPVVGEASFEDQGRSRVMLVNRGLLHVFADRENGRLLGAELIGPDAEHLAHLLAWAHQQTLTIDEILELPFYHPVVEEGLRTALRDARTQLERSRREPVKRDPNLVEPATPPAS